MRSYTKKGIGRNVTRHPWGHICRRGTDEETCSQTCSWKEALQPEEAVTHWQPTPEQGHPQRNFSPGITLKGMKEWRKPSKDH